MAGDRALVQRTRRERLSIAILYSKFVVFCWKRKSSAVNNTRSSPFQLIRSLFYFLVCSSPSLLSFSSSSSSFLACFTFLSSSFSIAARLYQKKASTPIFFSAGARSSFIEGQRNRTRNETKSSIL